MITENGSNMYMPVAPAYGGGYGNGGFGFGGDWAWILLLLVLGGGGWGGFGGMWPMMMGGGFGLGYDFPWLLAGQNNTNNQVNDGFRDVQISGQISGLRSDVTGGFSDTALGIAGLGRQVCETGNGVTAAVTGAQNAIAQQLYNNEINGLNRSFAEQTANVSAINGVQSKLADCCCENRLATQGVQNAILQDGSATRQAIAQGIQSIHDKLCQLELDGVRSELNAAQRDNATLQNQLNMAAFRADNVAQTAAIERSQADQTQYIVNRVAPYPIPAYPVSNPFGFGGYGWNGGGYGWNNGFGAVGFGNGSF